MKLIEYIKYFNNHNGYTTFRGSEDYVKPNVSYCETEKHVHYNDQEQGSGDENPEPLKAGSFYYSDGTFSNDLDTSKTCIGVCVIPKNFLPDGKARIMSLKEMDYNNPENGSLEHIKMYFGQNEVNTPIKNQTTFTTIDQNAVGSYEETTIGTNDRNGYLPSDRIDIFKNGIVNNVDKGTIWNPDADIYLPSPYIKVNGKEVLCPQYNSGALSDFDGKGNTDILTNLHTVEDWRTVSKITNDYYSNCALAAVCCARYKTEGTNSGDWYLPTIGELGFIVPRFNEIQNSLQTLGEQKALMFNVVYDYVYWSSSEYDSDGAFVIGPNDSQLGTSFKNSFYPYVRAFLAI